MEDTGLDRFIEDGKGLLIFDSEDAYRLSRITKCNQNHDPATGSSDGSGQAGTQGQFDSVRRRYEQVK